MLIRQKNLKYFVEVRMEGRFNQKEFSAGLFGQLPVGKYPKKNEYLTIIDI